MPVSNYAPELIALLRAGAAERIVIDGMTYARTTTLRHRLHRLRNAMRKEGHEATPLAERAVVRRQLMPQRADDRDKPNWQIVVEPADSEFAAILRAKGIEVDQIDAASPPPSLNAPKPATAPSASSTEAAVRRFLSQGDS